jgi:hypothetical protein
VAEKAGIDKGTLSVTPSVNAIAIEARFVNANMLNSVSRRPDIGSHFTNTTKFHFRNWVCIQGTGVIGLGINPLIFARQNKGGNAVERAFSCSIIFRDFRIGGLASYGTGLTTIL